MNKREFFNVLGAAAAAGFALGRSDTAQAASPYDLPLAFTRSDSVSLLHMTDCHAQLLPMYFREPSVNLGIAGQRGKLPHLVGNALLKDARIAAGSPEAYAFTRSISSVPPSATARSAASRTWPRWSSA